VGAGARAEPPNALCVTGVVVDVNPC